VTFLSRRQTIGAPPAFGVVFELTVARAEA